MLWDLTYDWFQVLGERHQTCPGSFDGKLAQKRENLDHVVAIHLDPGFIGYNDPSQSGRLIDRARELSLEFLAKPAVVEA